MYYVGLFHPTKFKKLELLMFVVHLVGLPPSPFLIKELNLSGRSRLVC